ncbi:MAG: zinc ribbon domain-containing protein [Acidobacteria bacterium]|nr:zinc ribbon domain-containing protein [Acidobacteriota bacterium]
MYCPNCATQTTDDVKFCRKCGANLRGVQEAMTGRTKAIDWDKTWVKEMLMSQEERERRQGITPEVKRMNEIKGGVITSAVGIGAMIFLYFFLGAVGANEGGKDAVILGRIWLAGLVPFLVGLALIFNGLVVSKRIVKLKQQQLEQTPTPRILSTTSTTQLPEFEAPAIPDYSVTEQPTYRLPQQPNKEMQ